MLNKKIFEKILDKLLLFKSFQDYINFRYNREGHVAVPKFSYSYYYVKGSIFDINSQLFSIDQVLNDYKFDDIKETDIVLDIGAHIGAFTIFSAKKAKNVFSVEPLFTEILVKNLELNNIKNVKVFELALGTDGDNEIRFDDRKKIINCKKLKEIKKLCGGHIDFLKIDCEGGEWCIRADEISDIRRIEAEIHNFDGNHNFEIFKKILTDAGFEFSIGHSSDTVMIIHAKHK